MKEEPYIDRKWKQLTIAALCFSTMVGVLLGIGVNGFRKPASAALNERSYPRYEGRSSILIVNITQAQDFYNNAQLLVSYSVDGIAQTQFIPEAQAYELYPRFLAYLREQGDVRILLDDKDWKGE